MTQFDELRPVKFKDAEEGEEFWMPLRTGHAPQGMVELAGPYLVHTTTGHVLNKLFQLPRRLEDHELMTVALDAKKRELYLMNPSDIVYARRE